MRTAPYEQVVTNKIAFTCNWDACRTIIFIHYFKDHYVKRVDTISKYCEDDVYCVKVYIDVRIDKH